jgi:hypothetical protein
MGYAFGLGLLGVLAYLLSTVADARPSDWRHEWPRTDFTKSSVNLSEIVSGGPPKDGIPPIDQPRFRPQAEIGSLGEHEPVVSVNINGDARAYPINVLIWHEIVNDTVGGVPVAVTYCPLCNTSIVFDRRLAGQILDFGTTGKLRRSDLVMYDRQTESWWQQFLGEGIVGQMTGRRLKMLPARLGSIALFRARHPEGLVLVPANDRARAYGRNPYKNYDSSARPFLYDGEMPDGVPPLSRVVRVGARAWSLALVRRKGGIITADGLKISWQVGQNSALGAAEIRRGATSATPWFSEWLETGGKTCRIRLTSRSPSTRSSPTLLITSVKYR